jgi:hypothetical protein
MQLVMRKEEETQEADANNGIKGGEQAEALLQGSCHGRKQRKHEKTNS